MKKVLLILVIAAIALVSQKAYATGANYEVNYTIDEPVVGAPIPSEVTAFITIDGEGQGTQQFHLFWYETDLIGYEYKKATSTKFEAGKYYRPSIVDVNFTTTTMDIPDEASIQVPGPAYSNCSFMGKGTNIETAATNLSNAFSCDMTLVEKINGEANKIFEIAKAIIKEVNITIDTEIAGIESKKGEEWPCWYGEPGDKCYLPMIYPTVTLGDNYKIGDDGKGYYIVGLPEDGDGYDASFFGIFEEGKQYIVETYIVPNDGYEFDDDVVVKVNGKTTGFIKGQWSSSTGMIIYSTITATAKKSVVSQETPITTYKLLKVENQTITSVNKDKPVSFEFDMLYQKFLDSGKVFVDDTLVDSKFFDSKEGSTIITLKKEYTDKLSAGEHTIKLTVADGEATGTFTIIKNPNTGDSILTYVWMLMIGLAGIFIIKKQVNY